MVDVIGRLGIPNTMHDTFRAFYEGVQQMSHPIDARRLRLLDDGDTLPAGGRAWQAKLPPAPPVAPSSPSNPTKRFRSPADLLSPSSPPTPSLQPHPKLGRATH